MTDDLVKRLRAKLPKKSKTKVQSSPSQMLQYLKRIK